MAARAFQKEWTNVGDLPVSNITNINEDHIKTSLFLKGGMDEGY